MSFSTLGLDDRLLQALDHEGYTQATPVQAQAIPLALAGQDLIVTAQTGSGKTAAFLLPTLQRLLAQGKAKKDAGVQALVLTPTRELALQVAQACERYCQAVKGLRLATVVGGMSYGAQIKALSQRVDVLIATPGRLLDHLQAKRVKLAQLQVLILDEADRMLDMGFIHDIEAIVQQTPSSRQTLMFSATFEGQVAQLAQDMLQTPERICIADQKRRHEHIKQCLLYADHHGHKFRLLDYLLRDANVTQAIVFTATKRGADDLADRLFEQGFAARALHGDMHQRQRNRTLDMLKQGKIQVLVATDVAARGIDVEGISHAINFDLPMQAEDYVHRIGRTGRAGRHGLAFTLATHSERFKVRRIEKFIGQSIPTDVIPGLEPTPKPSTKTAHNAGKLNTKGAKGNKALKGLKSAKSTKGIQADKKAGNTEKLAKNVTKSDVATVQSPWATSPKTAKTHKTQHKMPKRSLAKSAEQAKSPRVWDKDEWLSPKEWQAMAGAPRFADYARGARRQATASKVSKVAKTAKVGKQRK